MAMNEDQMGDDLIALMEYEGELMDTADWLEKFGVILLHTDGVTAVTREEMENATGALTFHPDSHLLFVNTAINLQGEPAYQNEADQTVRLRMLATAEAILEASM